MKATKRARPAAKKATGGTATKTRTRVDKGVTITKRDIEPIRNKLLAIRDDLVEKVKANKPDLDNIDVGDEADVASQSIEKELAFELSDNERLMLDQTEAALRKIDNGTYGICESCRTAIGRERIKALPFARYCIACQSRTESIPR